MNSEDKLKLVTNYEERVVNTPNIQVSYLDTVSSKDEEYIRILKQNNRNLIIDALVDDKWDELEKSKNEYPEIDIKSDMGVISMKIFATNINSNNFESHDKIWDKVLNLIDSNTKKPISTTNLNVQLSGDFEVDRRKVITKFVSSSNIISMNGRIGPATTAIVGQNCIQFLSSEQPAGIELVLEMNIDPDKIILIRKNRIDQPGIILVVDKENGNYYLKETPTFMKQICWFTVK